MNRFIVALSLAVALSATVLAQAQQPAGDDQRKDDQKPITIRGCLQGSPDGKQFVLATLPDPSSEIAAPTTGIANVSYQLVGGTDLQKHVGHTVEISGWFDPADKKTASTEVKSQTTETSVQPRPGPDKKVEAKVETTTRAKLELRRLNVKSMRHVASKCP